MNFSESIFLAIESIRANKLKTGLTLLSISIGVFAIIFAGSLSSSINSTLDSELSKMGETTFYLSKSPSMQFGNRSWAKFRKRKPISFAQLKELKRKMTTTDLISGFSQAGAMTVEYGDLKTDPDVTLMGADENFSKIYDAELEIGRPIVDYDVNFKNNSVILGTDIVSKIFPNGNALGKKVKIKNHQFEVVGVYKSRGTLFGQSRDNFCVIPLTVYLKSYVEESNESLKLMIKAKSKAKIDETVDETYGEMRMIRNVKPWEDNNFELETNKSLSDQFGSFTIYLSFFGLLCGGFALIAAGVGIMNIMLVSVKERTKEIGVRKAVGAKKNWILTQFLIETITLSQIGGIIGIILGFSLAAVLGKLIGLEIGIPYGWVLFSIIACTILGILSGIIPAWKAANLDPIDALRYE